MKRLMCQRRPTPDTPSPLACHRSGKDLSGVLRTARPGTHKSVITFSSLRDDVYAEVVQKASVSGVRWRRFPALNELLHGHRRGELTVFTGPTGAGKTTFISEYSLDLCAQGVHTLWGSFEIRNVRLAKMMLQQFNMAALDADAGRFDAVADAFQQLPLYFLAFHGQQSVKAVLDVADVVSFFFFWALTTFSFFFLLLCRRRRVRTPSTCTTSATSSSTTCSS